MSQANAQMANNTNQFNASQTQAASAMNAAANNTMQQQTQALTEQMNQQFVSGGQAQTLAAIQASSQQLIASDQTAASLYSGMTSAMSSMLGNQNIDPTRAADAMNALMAMTQNGLGVIDALNGMSLNLPATPSYGGNQGNTGITTQKPGP